MTFLILGDMGFGQLLGPSEFRTTLGADYAEHQVIEGKPLLQYTGPRLDAILLSFLFHADFCAPQTVWDLLAQALAEHKALPLAMGNGRMLGSFVITDIDRTTTYAADDGTLYAFECTLNLREYVDPTPLTTRRKAQAKKAAAKKKSGGKAGKPAKKKSLPAESTTGNALKLDKATVVKQATRQ